LKDYVTIVGAGLAGSEAAFQLARLGVKVKLFEMRPYRQTPAHRSGDFAELVCSNSFRSKELTRAAGLLKAEMRILNSLVMQVADQTSLPAGTALAVDRAAFAHQITQIIIENPLVEVIREEVKEIPSERPLILATGPLTSPHLELALQKLTGSESLYFYDAAAPIVQRESIEMSRAFEASRYGKGEGSYINCPLTEEEYEVFWQELVKAKRVLPHQFEQEVYFAACQPIEVLAKQGKQTLLFGPLKPVGLTDPRTGQKPFAVVQLRQDDAARELYSLVGFQTGLKWSEQERVFKLIPALFQAEFVRYGVMHRNTFINSPKLLKPNLEFKKLKGVFVAGQLGGTEGYIESAASGIVAALNAYALLKSYPEVVLPPTTALGSLLAYITNPELKDFQPMHASFGLLPSLEKHLPKKMRYRAYAERAVQDLKAYLAHRKELL
jgi:methylenetetrahydrofolate--tRNA-(uracil-5-)-methyltransferase